MRLSRLLIPFAILMIGLGLWQVGGPEQARGEQRDMQRMNDLRALAACLTCDKAREDGADRNCGAAPRDTDRFTEQPFTVTRTHVCAEFEQPGRITSRYPDELENGCLRLD